MDVHLTVDEATNGWDGKVGVGLCGRCNVDHRYICKDGPVFRMDEIDSLE